jgi:cell division septum initiation protein DivIVA
MPEDAQPGFPMVVDLGVNGGEHTFATREDVESWIRTEEEAWRWLLGMASELRNKFAGRFGQAKNAIAEYSVSSESSAPRLRDVLRNTFGDAGYVESHRPEAIFVFQLASETSDRVAASALARLVNVTPPESLSPASTEGLIRATLYQLGLKDSTRAEKLALESLRSDAGTQVEALRQEREQLTRDGKALREKFGSDSSAVIAETRSQGEAELELMRAAKRQAEEELRALTRTYDQDMALRAAFIYWTKRRTWQGILAAVWAALTIGTAVVGFNVVRTVLEKLKNVPSTAATGQSAAAEVVVQHSVEVAIGLLVLTLFLWALRILSRTFLASLNLSVDASERAVMVKTYLALLREKSLPEQAEALKVIVAALFRHSPTGLIKDDAGPNTPLDMVTRIFTK